MKFFDKFSEWVDVTRLKTGLMPRGELVNKLLHQRQSLLKSVPENERGSIEAVLTAADSLVTAKNFSALMDKSLDLHRQIEYIHSHYDESELGDRLLEHTKYFYDMPVQTSIQGGSAYNYFLNPWALFTYYSDMHWAVSATVNKIVSEAQQHGFRLEPKDGRNPSERSRAEAEKLIKQFKVHELVITALSYMLAYNNCIIEPNINALRQLKSFEVLKQDRLMPIFDLSNEKVIGWDYWIGHTSRFLKLNKILHIYKPSFKFPQFGIPIAASLATDLEADVGASNLNNAVINRAGMIGLILALKDQNNMSTRKAARLARRLEAEIQSSHSGYMNPNSVLATNLIDKVHRIFTPGEFEQSFPQLRNDCGKSVATVYDIPAEILNVIVKSQGVYEAKGLTDKQREQLNKTIARYLRPILTYANDVILPDYLNIDDWMLVANTPSWELTLDAAQAGLIVTQTGALITKNELRTLYGAPPLSKEDGGDEYIDNSKNREPDMLDPLTGKLQGPPMPRPKPTKKADAEEKDND